jgi:C_GCAxxG_C_C family probable redox protein
MMRPDKPEEAILAEAEAAGYEFEKTFHGCAQCVLAPVMKIFGIESPEAFKAASGLGGGVGLSAEGSCGGLTGGVMAIGLVHGRELDRIQDPENRRFIAYRMANRLHQRFVREYGSSICKEIHGKVMGRTYNLTDPGEWKAFLADGGHASKCPEVVGKAARWVCEILLEETGEEAGERPGAGQGDECSLLGRTAAAGKP